MLHEWKGFDEYYSLGTKKNSFLKNAYLSITAVMYYKSFLAYDVLIDGSASLSYP